MMIIGAWIAIGFGALGIIYPIIAWKKIIERGQKPTSSIIGGIFFITVGFCVLALYGETPETKILTLKEFKTEYNKVCSQFNAPTIGNIELTQGEKADIATLAISDNNLLKISVKKNESKHIIGFIFTITTTDTDTIQQILAVVYSVLKTMRPNSDNQVIKNFIAQVMNDSSGENHRLGDIVSSFKDMNTSAFLFIKYADEKE